MDEIIATGKFGDYKLHAELGRGGLSRVLRATHPVHDQVALKLLHRLGDDQDEQRFTIEREALVRVRGSSTGLVQLLDHGSVAYQTERGLIHVPYLALECIDGPTLQREINRGLEYSSLFRIGAELADSLGHAHSCGVVHRDIKPANIVISNVSKRPVIIDFGCAQILEGEYADITKRQDLETVGTQIYMSPQRIEQAMADPSAEINHTEDYFALGMTMLAGLLPDPDLLRAPNLVQQYSILQKMPVVMRESFLAVDLGEDTPPWIMALRAVQPYLAGFVKPHNSARYQRSDTCRLALQEASKKIAGMFAELNDSKVRRFEAEPRQLHVPWLIDTAQRVPYEEWLSLSRIRHGPFVLANEEQYQHIHKIREAPESQDAYLVPRHFNPRLQPVTIGRKPSNTIHIPDNRVSSKHAKITRYEDEYHLVELGSKNGTYVGTQQLVGGFSAPLRNGTPLNIGGAQLYYIDWSREIYNQMRVDTESNSTREYTAVGQQPKSAGTTTRRNTRKDSTKV